jgi:SAM-dependent methyltransferase
VAQATDLTIFGELSDLSWANLVLGAVPLPSVPPETLQRNWCGNSGAPLALQSADFYRLLKESYARHGQTALTGSMILDFGCGWGRITRLFAKDVHPDRIFGCDSDAQILEWCKDLPGTFRQSETRLRVLPFQERFDLAFAFSVFTHLGPKTHASALQALRASLAPNGLLIVTIRPRTFLETRASEFASLPDETIDRLLADYDAGEFVYLPYNMPEVEGEVPYGEAVVPLSYVERYWTDRFDLIDRPHYESDPYQIPLVLRLK